MTKANLPTCNSTLFHMNYYFIFMELFLYVFLFSLSTLVVFVSSFTSFTVIGGTSVLGEALCKQILGQQNLDLHKLYVSYRNQSKAQLFINNVKPHNKLKKSLQMFEYDLEQNTVSIEDLPGFGSCNPANHQILINTAGIIRYGNRPSDIKDQIYINAYAPVRLGHELLTKHYQRIISSSSLSKTNTKISIINISSGDGESVYLHSSVCNQLSSLTTMKEWFDLVNDYLTQSKLWSEPIEYAYGDTPGYSLSKAILNKGSELLHLEYGNHGNHSLSRVMAICPGNFQSPITTPADMITSESNRIDTNVASKHIVDIAIDFSYPGGKFYRFGKVIPW